MTTTTDRFEGSGSLQPEGGDASWPVEFSFVVRRTMVTRPGLPPAQGSATGRGTVSASDGTNLPDGFYRLDSRDGQRMRVQKLGGEWHILAPLIG
jgi:hypothetical protein